MSKRDSDPGAKANEPKHDKSANKRRYSGLRVTGSHLGGKTCNGAYLTGHFVQHCWVHDPLGKFSNLLFHKLDAIQSSFLTELLHPPDSYIIVSVDEQKREAEHWQPMQTTAKKAAQE
jgi:hypothetical protein